MDAYEATKIVFERIQNLDPQNASKIMGFLLIQDHGEKEMIRLAFGPESAVLAVISRVKKDLGVTSPNTVLTPPSNPRQVPAAPSRLNHLNQSTNSQGSWTSSGGGYADFQSLEDLVSPTGYSGGSCSSTLAAPFYGNGEIDLIDELQLQDQLASLNDGNPQIRGKAAADFFYKDLASSPSRNDAVLFYGGGHRRSFSVSDDDLSVGFGWKPCLFYARGYCKNGTTCRFLHGGEAGAGEDAGGANFPKFSPTSANQCVNFLQQLPSDSPRAHMMDGMHKFGAIRVERGELGINGANNAGSRQIYLTFPADSTFKEEDVSNYFSNFGPVQDVRIPYQQKRMFGFVTFDYPETVKLILAKGNPHFVCDARVLVKPYKEKGKIPEKHRKQQQQMGAEFAGCGSPTGLESRDPLDVQLGARIFHDARDILWRKKIEDQVDLQQAIELQHRRLLNLQLLDIKRNNHHRTLSTGAVVSSPTYSPTFFSQNIALSARSSSPRPKEESSFGGNISNEKEEENPMGENDLHERLEHNLPDSPFASPKAFGSYKMDAAAATFSEDVIVSSPMNNNLIIGSRFVSHDVVAPFKSCYFEAPSLASGHETVGM